MKRILCWIFVFLLSPVVAIANRVDQPDFPKPNHFDWDFLESKCGKVAFFSHKVNNLPSQQLVSIRTVYIEDDKVHPIEVRHYMKDGRQIIWVDRDRNGWFDQKFYDALSFITRYPTYCDIRIIRN